MKISFLPSSNWSRSYHERLEDACRSRRWRGPFPTDWSWQSCFWTRRRYCFEDGCWFVGTGTAFLLVATWSIGNLLFASTKPGFEKGQRSRLLLNTDGREWVDCLELCKSFRPSPRLSNVKTQRYTKSFAFAFGCRSTMWVEELLAQLVEPSEGVLIRCELWTGSSFVS